MHGVTVGMTRSRGRELKGYESVWLEPGETRTVTITLDPVEAFAPYDAALNRTVEPGAFTLFVGSDSTTTNVVRIKFSAGAS